MEGLYYLCNLTRPIDINQSHIKSLKWSGNLVLNFKNKITPVKHMNITKYDIVETNRKTLKNINN